MQDDERRWLECARRGDGAAFGSIVGAYQLPVFNLCYRMLGDRTEAEEAAQEIFLRGFRGLRRYDPNRCFVNWLLGIASKHCIDQLRRRRFRFISLEYMLPGLEIADPEPGFVRRWQARLAEDRAGGEWKQTLLTLGLADGMALALFLILGLDLWAAMSEPARLASIWLIGFNHTLSRLRLAQHLIRATASLATGLPPVWFLASAGLYSGLGGLWIYFVYRFSLRNSQNGVL